MVLNTRLLRVAGDVNREGRWGSDGACLKCPSDLCETAICDLAAINSDGTAVVSLDTDEDILLDLPASSNGVSLAAAWCIGECRRISRSDHWPANQPERKPHRVFQRGRPVSGQPDRYSRGVESSAPFVLADNGGQPLSAAQPEELLSTYDVNSIDPQPGLDGVTLRLKTSKDSQTRKAGRSRR